MPCSPGAAPAAVKVGLINWTSGNPAFAAFFSPATAGAEARVDEQNAAGGVSGRTLSLDIGDDAGDPTTNLGTARRLVESDSVFGIIEFPPSSVGSGAYLQQHGIPVVGWESSGDPWALRTNFFAYAGSGALDPAKQPTTTHAAFLKAHGVTNLALFGGPPATAVALTEADAAGARAIGLPIGFEDVAIPTGTGDFTADVAKTKAAGSDGFITHLETQTGQSLLKAMKQAGLREVGLFPAGYDQRVVKAFGPNLQGDFFATEFAPLELKLPGHQRYEADMAKYEPSALVGQLSLIGWLSADLFIKGLEVLGPACPNRQQYIKALHGVHSYDGEGLLPPVDFATQQGKPKLCYYYSQVEGTAYVPVSDKPFCGTAVGRG